MINNEVIIKPYAVSGEVGLSEVQASKCALADVLAAVKRDAETALKEIDELNAKVGDLGINPQYLTVVDYIKFNANQAALALDKLRQDVDKEDVDLAEKIKMLSGRISALRDAYELSLVETKRRLDVHRSRLDRDRELSWKLLLHLIECENATNDSINALREKDVDLEGKLGEIQNKVDELGRLLADTIAMIGVVEYPEDCGEQTIAGYLAYLLDLIGKNKLACDENLERFANEIYALIGEFVPTDDYHTLVEYIEWVKDDLLNALAHAESRLDASNAALKSAFDALRYHVDTEVEPEIYKIKHLIGNFNNPNYSNLVDWINGELIHMRTDYSTSINALEQKHDADINRLRTEVNQNIENLTVKHDGDISQLHNYIDENIENLTVKHDNDINWLHDKLNKNIDNLRAQHTADITVINNKLVELDADINVINENIGNLSDKHDADITAINNKLAEFDVNVVDKCLKFDLWND